MNKIISTLNCSGCSQAMIPALIMNCSLPMGEKIDFVNAHSGRAGLRDLLNIDPTGDWELPHFILDKRTPVKDVLGNIEKGRGKKLSLSPSADIDTNYENLKAYLLR